MRDLTPFSNRLSKNHRHLAKWAKRQDTECYRLYDRDIPEFPVIVDVYGASAHIQEVDTGWQIDEDSHAAWLDAIRQAVAEVLAIAVDDIALKTRRRQKGLAQYEKTGETGRERIVSETGRRFIVNLEAYLDTGLFLDHRNTRRVVGEHAAGKRFLNLFAYTGSFTVYAATGGAISSVTVDLSNTYQDWSRRNFELNGLDLSRHSLVRADAFRYLQDAAAAGERFDLIVMDPPSFSNSKKMLDILDVQRDQQRLVDGAMALLAPGGVLYFSNNLRGFKLDPALAERYRVEDISAKSVPEDFRNRKIHQCFRVTAR